MDNTLKSSQPEKFDFSSLFDTNFFLNIVGRTGSGKSILLYNLLYSYSNFKFIYYFTKNKLTAISTSEVNNYIWSNHIIDATTENIGIVMAHLTTWTIEANKENEEHEKFKTLFIFDDIGRYPKEVYENMISSRHSNISMIFLTHSLTDLHIDMRKQLTCYAISNIFSSAKEIEKHLHIRCPKQCDYIFNMSQKIHQDKEQKKYLILDNVFNTYYYIVPIEFVKEHKNKKINILHLHQSFLKEKLIEELKFVNNLSL